MVQSEVLERRSVALRRAAVSWPALLAGAAFLSGMLILMVLAALHKGLNHDENMYVGSGLLLREGTLPYLDYPYFQMPLLSLVYAAVMWSPGDALLWARMFNVACAAATCVVVFAGVWVVGVGASVWVKTLLGVGGVALYVANPQFVYASGLAWNHDLPILLTVCGVAALARGIAFDSGERWVFASGVLFGLATCARLSFAAAIPVMGLAVVAVGQGRTKRIAIYLGGAAMGLLPALLFFVANPAAFWFGNVEYHMLNEQYWANAGYTRAMDLGGKTRYLWDVMAGEPFNWLLVAGSIIVGIALWRARARGGTGWFVYLPAIAAGALLVGALVPSPTWLQYFYAPSALLTVALVWGAAYLARDGAGAWARVGLTGATVVTVVSILSIAPGYANLFRSADNVPAAVESTAAEIRGLVGADGRRVATLAPVYALQAGMEIYPELESGPFALRVAPFVGGDDAMQPGVVAGDGVSSVLGERPPDALLTGAEGDIEAPLVQFGTEHGYRKATLSNGFTLWLKGK